MQTFPVSLKGNGDGMAISTLYLNWKGKCCWIATSPSSLKGYGGDEIGLLFVWVSVCIGNFITLSIGEGEW